MQSTSQAVALSPVISRSIHTSASATAMLRDGLAASEFMTLLLAVLDAVAAPSPVATAVLDAST
jgi:hypothetical protein